MSRIEQAAQGRRRWISIGTTPWIAANVLPPAVREFRERRPDLRVRLFDGDFEYDHAPGCVGQTGFRTRHSRQDSGPATGSVLSLFSDGRTAGQESRDRSRFDAVVRAERRDADFPDAELSASAT